MPHQMPKYGNSVLKPLYASHKGGVQNVSTRHCHVCILHKIITSVWVDAQSTSWHPIFSPVWKTNSIVKMPKCPACNKEVYFGGYISCHFTHLCAQTFLMLSFLGLTWLSRLTFCFQFISSHVTILAPIFMPSAKYWCRFRMIQVFLSRNDWYCSFFYFRAPIASCDHIVVWFFYHKALNDLQDRDILTKRNDAGHVLVWVEGSTSEMFENTTNLAVIHCDVTLCSPLHDRCLCMYIG